MIRIRRLSVQCPRFGRQIMLTRFASTSDDGIFFYNYDPPYPNLTAINRLSVDLGSHESSKSLRDVTNTEFVQKFADLSASYRCFETEVDLRDFVNEFQARRTTFTFEELVLAVKALTFWPQAVRRRNLLLRVPDQLELNVRQIYDILSEECNNRLWVHSCTKETYITISYDNLENVLELCEVWTKIDQMSTFKAQSFVPIVINKIGNSSSNTKSKFRRFDKHIFIKFMKLAYSCPLIKEFHTYYCTIKFLDLLPTMNLDEITEVLKTFVKQSFFGTHTHPIQLRLRQEIIKIIINNLSSLQSETLEQVSKFIYPIQCRALIEDCLVLQRKLFEAGLVEKLSPSSLILLVNQCTRNLISAEYPRGDAVYLPLVDAIVVRLLAEDESSLLELGSKMIDDLAFVIGLHRDTPAGRMLLLKIRDSMLKNDRTMLMTKDMAPFNLSMAFLGLYNQDTCSAVFSALTFEKDGKHYMDKSVRFRQGSNRVLGGQLLALQGMIESEFPEYQGPKITGELEDTIRVWTRNPLPTQAEGEELDRVKTSNALKFYHLLEETLGKGKVYETVAFPFSGAINYVALLDQDGTPLELPEQFTSQPLYQTKTIDQSLGDWILIYPKYSYLEHLLQFRTGGVRVANRQARLHGYIPVFMDYEHLIYDLSEDSRKEYIVSCLKQTCNNIQL